MSKAVILILLLTLTTISVISSASSGTPSSNFFKENIHMIRTKGHFMDSQWFADLSLINFVCRDQYDTCLNVREAEG